MGTKADSSRVMLITYITDSWSHDGAPEEHPPPALTLAADWTATIYDHVRSTLQQMRKKMAKHRCVKFNISLSFTLFSFVLLWHL